MSGFAWRPGVRPGLVRLPGVRLSGVRDHEQECTHDQPGDRLRPSLRNSGN